MIELILLGFLITLWIHLSKSNSMNTLLRQMRNKEGVVILLKAKSNRKLVKVNKILEVSNGLVAFNHYANLDGNKCLVNQVFRVRDVSSIICVPDGDELDNYRDYLNQLYEK